jgi:hypothetical protein
MIITTKQGVELTICDECHLWDRDVGFHGSRCSVGRALLVAELAVKIAQAPAQRTTRATAASGRPPAGQATSVAPPGSRTTSTHTDPYGLMSQP